MMKKNKMTLFFFKDGSLFVSSDSSSIISFLFSFFLWKKENSRDAGDNPLVSEGGLIYLNDVYEHTVQIIEDLEIFHDKLTSAHDVYLSTASNRMNEIMKVLTIFSSTFIPLSFLAGLYGMNFKFMPELDFPWAYPVLLCIMLFVSCMLLLFFKRKKWIGWKRRKRKQPYDFSRKHPVK